MRYDRNRLKFIEWVCETYQQHCPDRSGLSNREILRRHINTPSNPRHISEATLYNYLNVPYKKLLKELEAAS